MRVLVNMRLPLNEFDYNVAAMSNLDFDLDQILVAFFSTLQTLSPMRPDYQQWFNECLQQLLPLAQMHGVYPIETPTAIRDSEILTNGLRILLANLFLELQKYPLWDNDGKFRFRYENNVNGSLHLIRNT